ncbi:MAG: hypothetical protein L6R42_009002 [Xanthoria sp. 1 TBL-2021]|nr:MAG: hypothetical protein L6R42_009002 [Xanthoria sp. 1 TBL-2021]
MSIAYLTAELWLGAMNSLIALLLPPRTKTFGLAVWSLVQVLIYSSGPEIVGLALRTTEPTSSAYIEKTRIALAVMIPIGYWLAGVGFLLAVPLVKLDLAGRFVEGRLSWGGRKGFFIAGGCVLGALVVSLFTSLMILESSLATAITAGEAMSSIGPQKVQIRVLYRPQAADQKENLAATERPVGMDTAATSTTVSSDPPVEFLTG